MKYDLQMIEEVVEYVGLDALDRRILAQMQQDASLTNQDLAQAVLATPATCLRRVRRLRELGLIERVVALLNPQVAHAVLGAGLDAVAEVSLDIQNAERLDAFEARATACAEVQQVLRVSPGPDFVLYIHVRDMPAYQVLAQSLFAADSNVRNVRAFFVTKRAKFEPSFPVA
jgi:Lrp/AsnC family transcriptional regulator, leucine-responsive regulatory protein